MTDILIPERPGWCLEEEEGNAPTDNETNGRIQNRGKRKQHGFQNEVWSLRSCKRTILIIMSYFMMLQNAKFVDGVHGVSVVGPPKREQIQQQVQFILKWDQ